MTGLSFRPAVAADVDVAVPLIHSSGPAAFEYVFAVAGVGDALAFLRRAFVDGAGEFGWRNHVVGELDGVVVAVGAGYGGYGKGRFMLAAAREILWHYGWRPAAGGGAGGGGDGVAGGGGGGAVAFRGRGFVEGAGECGWRNHVVGERDGGVVAVGAGYGGYGKWRFMLAAARQILGHYGWRHAAGVMVRGLRVESVIPPPAGARYYLGHLGVSHSLRGNGCGTALVGSPLGLRPLDRKRLVEGQRGGVRG